MPVQQRAQRSPRALVIAAVTLAVGVAALLGLFIYLIPSLTEQDSIEVKLGPERFTAGNVDNLITSVDEAPLLLPDVAGGERDVYLAHLGDDPEAGWVAFDARRPGQSRDCTLTWNGDRAVFVDPCDGTEVAADGGDQRSYPVEITEDRDVVVDLRGDSAEDGGGGGEDVEPTTTSSILVTGTLDR